MMTGEYKAIYPRLADYWDRPLAELPSDLMPIVTALFFALDWDDADMDERQERIKGYDQSKDPANEGDTWTALYLFLPYDGSRDIGLWTVIAQAKRDGKDSVAAVLTDIAKEILVIATANYPTDGIQSVLWPALYRLSLSLAARREEAMKGKDYQLANALDDVAAQFVRILDIDRERVGDTVAAAIVQGVPVGRADGAGVFVKDATSKANDEPLPGRLPRTAIGKLVIKAAWEIEWETKRVATVDAVIAKLQTRVDTEDALTAVIKNGVSWMTGGLKVKDFDIDACSKALKTWHSSRA
jgi:hypothetical protein